MKVKGKNNMSRPRKFLQKEGLTRKQRRKKERRLNKAATAERYNSFAQKRTSFYKNSFQNFKGPGKYVRVRNPSRGQTKDDSDDVIDSDMEVEEEQLPEEVVSHVDKKNETVKDVNSLDTIAREIKREKAKLKKVQAKMAGSRKQALLDANEEEDREIKMLEKQLNFGKRKKKGLPKAFVASGLDYILDVCDPEKRSAVVAAEKNLTEITAGLDDDIVKISGKQKRSEVSSKSKSSSKKSGDISDEEEDSDLSSDEQDNSSILSEENSESEDYSDLSEDDAKGDIFSDEDNSETENDKSMQDSDGEGSDIDNSEDERSVSESGKTEEERSVNKTEKPEENKIPVKNNEKNGLWEDIYGRKRDRQGNVIEETGKYIPPHLRATNDGDSKKKEELERLRKRLKGLVNRLAEANLHSIAVQVEEAYRDNSRRSVNEVLTALMSEAIAMPSIVPERCVMEHCALVAALHANIGSEVGAFILQYFVKKFTEMFSQDDKDVSDKTLDNLLSFICHLFTFKVCGAGIVLDLVSRSLEKFGEKEVELVLVALRSVGFALRKENPSALKDLVLRARTLAADAKTTAAQSSRVKFLLEVLLTIKNNNVAKLPQHDPAMAEQLRKKLRGVVRAGNVIAPLHIPLSDLLEADERGRWWLVGSAWTGQGPAPMGASEKEPTKDPVNSLSKMSSQLADLARKLRISTDSRRAIFSILMTAEDCNEGFEKLMRLKGAMGRDVAAVLVHCVQAESSYNPYYALVADKLVRANRQHQMSLQCTLWDKFKEADNMQGHQVTNLAKFMAQLFLEGALPLSVLKTVQFVDMTGGLVKLIRQTLLSVLLHKNGEMVSGVWSRIATAKPLAGFRESIRLFLHHFVLKAVGSSADNNPQQKLLRDRITAADVILQGQL